MKGMSDAVAVILMNTLNKRAVKPTWIAFAEDFDGSRHFLFADALVFLSLGGGFEALPGQRAQVEIHEDVAQGLQVIPSGLFCKQSGDSQSEMQQGGVCSVTTITPCSRLLTDTQMCVYGGVAGRAGQVLVLTVGDVLVCAGVAVFFGQAKVDYVHQVALLAEPHQKVVRLHISVDEVLGVDVLDAADLEAEANIVSASERLKCLNKQFL